MATVRRTQWVVGQRKKLLPAAIPTASWERLKNTFAQLPASYFRKQYFVLLLLIWNFFTFLLDKFSLIGIFCYFINLLLPFIYTIYCHTHTQFAFISLFTFIKKRITKQFFLEKNHLLGTPNETNTHHTPLMEHSFRTKRKYVFI